MAGYDGCRMSNNAVAAYENGEMPISKWTKNEILKGIEEKIENEELLLKCSFEKLKKVPKGALQEHCLRLSSWHHTGGACRQTFFHELDSDKIEELTDKDLDDITSAYKESQKELKKKKEQEVEEEIKCECSFPIWPKSAVFRVGRYSRGRSHSRPKVVTEIGTIKGDWFIRPNGSRKSIYSNGFEILRRI